MKENCIRILLSPLFLIGLFVLLLNDFVLKPQFHNFLTGKLSDFAGLFVFALFWTAFFPKYRTIIFSFITVFFAFWKSPFADGLINAWNSTGLIRIGRTIDMTDLITFVVLPIAWIYSEKSEPIRLPRFSLNFAPVLIALVSVFAFTATSQSKENYHNEEFSEIYKIEKTPVDLLKRLQDYETEYFSESRDRRQNLITIGLRLRENVCDDLPYASFEISKDGEAGSQINLKSISYECGEKISGNSNSSNNSESKEKLLENRNRLKEIFENEVLEFMKN